MLAMVVNDNAGWQVPRGALWFIASTLAPTGNHISIHQFGPVTKLLQRLGIGQGISVLHFLPMHHIAHRQLNDLAADGPGNVRHCHNLRRHMTRRGIGANRLADLLLQRLVQFEPVAQAYGTSSCHC